MGKATRNKDKMHFARLMVEVKIDGELSYIIEFANEQGILMQ